MHIYTDGTFCTQRRIHIGNFCTIFLIFHQTPRGNLEIEFSYRIEIYKFLIRKENEKKCSLTIVFLLINLWLDMAQQKLNKNVTFTTDFILLIVKNMIVCSKNKKSLTSSWFLLWFFACSFLWKCTQKLILVSRRGALTRTPRLFNLYDTHIKDFHDVSYFFTMTFRRRTVNPADHRKLPIRILCRVWLAGLCFRHFS